MLLSLRDQLTGAVVDLLSDEKMACVPTQEGLVSLVSALAAYREEGRALFPEVLIFDNLEMVLKTLPSGEHVPVGSGTRQPETMARALKQCAPLARGDWVVYVHRQQNAFSFGLLRSGVHELSVPISNILIESGAPEIPALVVRPVAENVVEIRGVEGSSLLVHFGATRATTVSPVKALEGLVECLVSGVAERVREQAHAFYSRLLITILRESHGTIAAVQPHRRRAIPARLRDGIVLRPPLKVVDAISELLVRGDCQANTRLHAEGALISGMLQSDGITVFASDGSVRAYNVFVRHQRRGGSETQVTGGARRRTFDTLCTMIGQQLECVFMQSQDGSVDLRSKR